MNEVTGTSKEVRVGVGIAGIVAMTAVVEGWRMQGGERELR